MRDNFGHMGDAFEGIREIYDTLAPGTSARSKVLTFAWRMADMTGEWPNLNGYWPEFYDECKKENVEC